MEFQEVITKNELLATLQIAPNTLRRILREYGSVLQVGEGGEVPPEALPTLQKILQLRAEGRRRREILAELTGSAPSADWLAKLESIERHLMRAEAMRLEDRDRLLTALMRTQQELAHLREELLLVRSRKDRRRRGLFRFVR